MIDVDNIERINGLFVYDSDTSVIDNWDVLPINKKKIKGDCEDYSLTLLFMESDENWLKFFLNIMMHKYTMFFCKAPSGENHAILYHDGFFVDNIMKKLMTKEDLKEKGYSFFVPYPNIVVLFKLLLGIVIRS